MKIGELEIGNKKSFLLIAGPCVVESEDLAIDSCGYLQEITKKLNIPFIYKSSFAKANRSSHQSFSGLGIEKSLQILKKVKDTFNVKILTDVHEDSPLAEISQVVDVMQTPALLCRQTNFIQRVAKEKLPMNIKKGQFLSPWEMANVVKKCEVVGNKNIILCERGSVFGYNNLVVDMRSLKIMQKFGYPVIFDASHSTQLPGKLETSSGGESEFIETLARAAIGVGIAGIFIETHPKPEIALCDGPNSYPLHKMAELLKILQSIDRVVKKD